MLESYLVYGTLIITSLMLAKRAQKYNDFRSVVAIIGLCTFVAGFRAYSVGIDTSTYVGAFSKIENGLYGLVYMEEGFEILCGALLFLSANNYTVLLLLFALITNTLIIYRLWELRDKISFTMAIFLYFAIFYMQTMNIMRQYVAIAIVFFATRYIHKRNYVKFVLSVLLAAMFFHKSAVVGLIYLAMEVFLWKYLSKRQKFFIGTMILCSPLFLYMCMVSLVDEYSHYLQDLTIDVGVLSIVKIAFFVLSIFMFRPRFERVEKIGEIQGDGYILLTTRISYLVGICLVSLGYVYEFVGRIGLYFSTFEMVYLSWLVRTPNRNNRTFFRLVIIVLWGYLLMQKFISNGYGQHPYLFIWQTL